MGRVNGGLNLTRSFGDFDYKAVRELPWDEQMITCKPDVQIIDRHPDDEFIICGCDGVWERYVDNSSGLIEVLREEVRSKKALRPIMEGLLDKLLAEDTSAGLGCDNMTGILIKLKP